MDSETFGRTLKRPHGLTAVLLRAPLALDRIGLGRVLGQRFLILTHVGRKTGRVFRTPLEVVDARRGESWTVVAGWGNPPSWYLNVVAAPPPSVRVAGRTYVRPGREVLSADEAATVLHDYASRYPRAARVLCRVLAWPPPSAESFRLVAQHVPLVRFRVRS